ncbi:MAG: A/G-specific adenine glycosylase [Candidatus Dadabacteria bacterium]|nr:MAG: A/G-specific adenine glycosylase [Candidatus Dadabacteria bacterium]
MDGVLSDALLSWYRQYGRELPWRSDTPDPWIVLVSEFLLQQTRVETIAPRFDDIIRTIPDPASCARLEDSELDRLWQGLGYYRRARNLRAAARQICERHDGRVPDQADALAALTGIGPYTTGAIMAIAFNQPVPGVDGNIARVWARTSGTRCRPSEAATPARQWLANLFETGEPRQIMQAVMDLGATICTPRAPRCDACPLASDCVARQWPDPTETPIRQQRKPTPHDAIVHAWITDGRNWFLEYRPRGLLGERPAPFCLTTPTPPDTLRFGHGHARLHATGPAFRHVFTHRRWSVTPALYHWKGHTPPQSGSTTVVTIDFEQLNDLGLPRAFSRALPWLLKEAVARD